jgi:hypothetical protein
MTWRANDSLAEVMLDVLLDRRLLMDVRSGRDVVVSEMLDKPAAFMSTCKAL